MGCGSSVRSVRVGKRVPVWSKGGSPSQGLSDIFVFAEDEIKDLAPRLAQLRATIVLENCTPDAEVEVVFQATNDGCTWDNPVAITQAFLTADQKVTTPWHTQAADFKRGIRVGVRIRQATSVTEVQHARVTLTFDFELRT